MLRYRISLSLTVRYRMVILRQHGTYRPSRTAMVSTQAQTGVKKGKPVEPFFDALAKLHKKQPRWRICRSLCLHDSASRSTKIDPEIVIKSNDHFYCSSWVFVRLESSFLSTQLHAEAAVIHSQRLQRKLGELQLCCLTETFHDQASLCKRHWDRWQSWEEQTKAPLSGQSKRVDCNL